MICRIIIVFIFSFLLVNASCNANSLSQDSLQIEFYKMPCAGEGDQWCYVLRINKGEQQYFHGEIKGLKYEWGYRYNVLAEKIQQQNVPADAASFVYHLKQVLQKEKVSSTTSFELPLQMNEATLVKYKSGKYSIFNVPIIQSGGFTNTAISKASSGIFTYQTGDRPGLVLKGLKP